MKEGLSLRDRAILMIVGVVALYVVAALGWFVSVHGKWTLALKNYSKAVKKYEQENRLISQSDRWNADYLQEKSKMPMFPEDEAVDTHWLNLMDALAVSNYVAISKRQAGKEEEKGDVFELPLDVSSWEGSLEGLVKFLWDLQSNESSMMDVSSLQVRPSQKKGFLKGSFTITCAYMRGDVDRDEEEEETVEPATQAAAAEPTETEPSEATSAAQPAAEAPATAGEAEEQAAEPQDDLVEKPVGQKAAPAAAEPKTAEEPNAAPAAKEPAATEGEKQ